MESAAPGTHLQEILHAQDVAAQDGRLQLLDSDGFAPPRLRHARDDVVAPDAGELLGEHLGLPVGQVGVLGDDGCFGHHDARAGVLEVSVDANLITWGGKDSSNLGWSGLFPWGMPV